MRPNLLCCLGLIDNGRYKSTNRLLVVVPHERPHGIMRILKNLCMLLPKALKMRPIKDTVALVASSIGGTKGAPTQMSWHLRHLNPALLNRQGMSTHPKMESGSELCQWKGQLIIGLCVDPVRPCKPPQIGAKLGTPSRSTTRQNVKPPLPPPPPPPPPAPKETCLWLAWPCEKQGDQHYVYGHLKTARPNLQAASEFQQPSCSNQDCQEHQKVVTQNIRMKAALVHAEARVECGM